MNRETVACIARAVGAWLEGCGSTGTVIVGRDGRHGSEAFAEEICSVLSSSGHDVQRFADPVPTPQLAHAVRHLGAVAGLMVTASHNPASDNGVKVYARGGLPVSGPDEVDLADELARRLGGETTEMSGRGRGLVSTVPAAVTDEYLAALVASTHLSGPAPTVAWTSMHGVGGPLLSMVLDGLGVAWRSVAEQADPDPDFPTVTFPNPEEPGALDRVLALAADSGADLALALDPDADRLAVAVPVAGGWQVLTGDEVGVLLADHLLGQGWGPNRFVATTVVSSALLSRIAEAHGVPCFTTLTGFKWLAATVSDHPGLVPVLRYEEALGYCVGDLVPDKDGIGAAAAFVALAAACAASGSSVLDRLDDLHLRHGLHRTGRRTLRFPPGRAAGLNDGPRLLDRLGAAPPAELGGVAITDFEDLARGGPLPPADVVVLHGEGLRVSVRPSGTEPMVKVYVEVIDASVTASTLAASRRSADLRIASVLDDLVAMLS